MIARYPALFRDAHSEMVTVIENDGRTLRMVVRGVEFMGTMLMISSRQLPTMTRRWRHSPFAMVHSAHMCSSVTCRCQSCVAIKY
jgi:hypothetical protein